MTKSIYGILWRNSAKNLQTPIGAYRSRARKIRIIRIKWSKMSEEFVEQRGFNTFDRQIQTNEPQLN